MADFIAGIDVSHHQKPIDWQRVATAGYRYAFVRASYGSKLKDRRFSEHWSGATAAGLLVSAYHFMRTSNPVAEQVDFFLDVLGDRKPDLPLALDVEADPFPAEDAPLSRAAWTQWTVECLDRIEAAGHRRPILYTAGAFWNANLERSERWSGHDLWVAHYTAAAQPRLPLDWRSWRFWQFTSQGQVPGVDGNTDVNRLPGTEADLLAYAGRAAGPAPVTPLLQARVDAPVNVRSGPSIKFDRVGMLTAADVGRLLPVHDIGGSDAWIRIAANRWVACSAPGGPLCRVEVAPDGRVQAHVLGTGLGLRGGRVRTSLRSASSSAATWSKSRSLAAATPGCAGGPGSGPRCRPAVGCSCPSTTAVEPAGPRTWRWCTAGHAASGRGRMMGDATRGAGPAIRGPDRVPVVALQAALSRSECR